jgi:low affinity Fe/Cu permease
VKERVAALALAIDNGASRPESLAGAIGVCWLWFLFALHDHFGTLSMNAGSNISGWIPFVGFFAVEYTASRNASALHAKIDALIHAVEAADNRYIGIEKKTDAAVAELHGEICP